MANGQEGARRPWWPAGVLILLSTVVGAEEPPVQVNPNRPTFATPAATTQVGAIELEAGLQHTLPREGGALSFSPFLLKLGLSKRVEVRLGGNGLLRQQPPEAPAATGFGDTTLGVQWTYLRGGPFGVDQAVQVTWKIPTASATRGLGSGEADGTAMLILSRDAGPFHVDVNLLETWLGRPKEGGGGTDAQAAGTVSVSRTLDERWSLTVEVYSIGATSASPRVTSNLWAVGYKVSPSLVLDGGFDIGLTKGAQKVSFFAGLTRALGRFRRLPTP